MDAFPADQHAGSVPLLALLAESHTGAHGRAPWNLFILHIRWALKVAHHHNATHRSLSAQRFGLNIGHVSLPEFPP